eukprot:14376978-Ditylum_brightwellii.AAC.1
MERLKGANGKISCEFCNIMWKTKTYHGKETGTFDKDVKRTKLGCLYCNITLCKSDISSTITNALCISVNIEN